MSFVGTNVDPVGVTVDWASKTCTVNGALLGATVENRQQCAERRGQLQGTLVNQPPTARAGADQTVECTSAAGAAITLDGTSSSDPDNNIDRGPVAAGQPHRGCGRRRPAGDVPARRGHDRTVRPARRSMPRPKPMRTRPRCRWLTPPPRRSPPSRPLRTCSSRPTTRWSR